MLESTTALGTAPPRSRALSRRLLAWLFRACGLLPALLPALLFLPVVLAPPVNHDVAAVLSFSQRMVAGEHLYTDLIDVNPPLIYVLNLIPAQIAAWTGIDAVTCMQFCLLLLGTACWRLFWIARDRAAEGVVERRVLDALPCLLLLGAGYDFGQREHLMVVAALPYLAGASRRAANQRAPGGLASSVIAGLGFALKPHFLAVPALVELVVLISRRDAGWAGWARGLRRAMRDPVLWTLVAVWAAYLASLPLVFPDYLNTVVPLVWDFYLDLGGLSPWLIFLNPRFATAMCLLVPCVLTAFWSIARESGAGPTLPRLLAAAGIGAAASAIAQHKGWSYHIVPIELFAGSAAILMVARFLDRGLPPGARPSLVAGALTSLIALYSISNGEAPWKQLAYPHAEVAGLTALLEKNAPDARVLVLSPGIYPIYPALNYAGAHMTLRTMNMWLLEGAYETCLANGKRYRDVWEMGRAEFFVYRTVAEDFARSPPAAVVVDRQPGIPWCGREFSFLEYFKRHPLFAEVWSHYKLTAEWDRYRIYTRKD